MKITRIVEQKIVHSDCTRGEMLDLVAKFTCHPDTFEIDVDSRESEKGTWYRVEVRRELQSSTEVAGTTD